MLLIQYAQQLSMAEAAFVLLAAFLAVFVMWRALKGSRRPYKTGRRFSEMSGFDQRMFCLGLFLTAAVLAIFDPIATGRAIRRVLEDRQAAER